MHPVSNVSGEHQNPAKYLYIHEPPRAGRQPIALHKLKKCMQLLREEYGAKETRRKDKKSKHPSKTGSGAANAFSIASRRPQPQAA